jgi:hypothetical protein
MTTTNLLEKGEVSSKRRLLAVKEQQNKGGPKPTSVSSVGFGGHRVVEDGMVGTWCELNRENPAGAEPAFMIGSDPKKRRRWEVRASIVARKRSNVRGAKGRRKMDAYCPLQRKPTRRRVAARSKPAGVIGVLPKAAMKPAERVARMLEVLAKRSRRSCNSRAQRELQTA